MTVLRHPLSALVSFHYFRLRDVPEIAHFAAGGLRLIADSGAYSALSKGVPVDLAAYAQWCHAVAPHTTWTASLDVIGDAERSWRNWRDLTRDGLATIPTIHYGAAPETLDRYAEQGVDLIGLGGMVGRKGEVQRLLRWTVHVMRHARTAHPQVRFHGWGIRHHLLLASLPWYSVDSSGWGTGYRYGHTSLFDPDRGRYVRVDLDGRHAYRHGRLLRTHYGVDPARISLSNVSTRTEQVRLGARSAQLVEDWLRARHAVPPPRYGVRDGGTGTHVHLVDSAPRNLRSLLRTRQEVPA